MTSIVDDMEATLSYERFARYLGWAAGDKVRALELYTLNTRLSEALYVPMQTLELVLRNKIHSTMAQVHGDLWFETPVLTVEHQQSQVADARARIEAEGRVATAGRLVASLTFSFWTTMLSSEYEELWRHGLSAIAAREGKSLPRKKLSEPLGRIRGLRNRIAHHEPILYWSLAKHHRSMLDIIERLSPAAAEWNATVDRFSVVLPEPVYVLDRQADEENSVVASKPSST